MGKQSGSQTTTQKTELPQWVQDAGQKNLNAAYQVSANMMGPYSGQRVASMTPGAMDTINALQNNVGSTNPGFAYAQGTAGNLTNYQPGQVNAGALANTDLSSYMNPYTQNVINSGLQSLDLQRQQALNQVGDQALKTGAFGGSRHGISEGVTNAGAAMQAGTLASNLMNQNFLQAQGAAQNDLNRNFQGQLANQQAGLQGAGLNLSAANALGALLSHGQNAFLQGTGAAMAGQGAIQNQNQQQLDAERQQYAEQQQFPLQQLQIPLQALGMTPYGSTSTSSVPTSGSSWLSGLGTLLGGIGSIAPYMSFSDENEKTNIQELGKHPVTGLPMYAYDYKADVAAAKKSGQPMPPKRVGPMAQDIEKTQFGSVGKIGGKKVVNGSLGFGG